MRHCWVFFSGMLVVAGCDGAEPPNEAGQSGAATLSGGGDETGGPQDSSSGDADPDAPSSAGTSPGGADDGSGDDSNDSDDPGSDSSDSGSATGNPPPGDAEVCLGFNNGSGTTVPCATTADGRAMCFDSASPMVVTYAGGDEVSGVRHISGRNFTAESCVVLDSGAVHCGHNHNLSPTPVIDSGASMVSGSLDSACALVGGDVQCWSGNDSPVTVALPEAARQVACYYHGCCAVTNSGGLHCWGDTAAFGAGNSSPDSPATPNGLDEPVAYAGPGQDHLCVVLDSGRVQCWGQDWNAQLGGNGADTDAGVTLVDSGARAVVGGQFHTCVLLDSGQVQCTSSNQSEGAGLDMGMLATVPGIEDAVALSAGKHYSCALLADDTVQCWGSISGGADPAAIEGLTTSGC
ncbi:MAG: hypothetical protein AAGF11_37685 [Myxococcota bacterium]